MAKQNLESNAPAADAPKDGGAQPMNATADIIPETVTVVLPQLGNMEFAIPGTQWQFNVDAGLTDSETGSWPWMGAYLKDSEPQP